MHNLALNRVSIWSLQLLPLWNMAATLKTSSLVKLVENVREEMEAASKKTEMVITCVSRKTLLQAKSENSSHYSNPHPPPQLHITCSPARQQWTKQTVYIVWMKTDKVVDKKYFSCITKNILANSYTLFQKRDGWPGLGLEVQSAFHSLICRPLMAKIFSMQGDRKQNRFIKSAFIVEALIFVCLVFCGVGFGGILLLGFFGGGGGQGTI